MIPPDVANGLRVVSPLHRDAAQAAQTQPVVATQRVADVLSNLVPGQRILAEIQALLPNGSYRATVAQRDITLALPFSAKPGDSLELEVVESDGNLTLAFVANRGSGESKLPDTSVATTLSRAGQLIADLMQGVDGQGKRAPAAPLNGNQALVPSMPANAADLAPVLKQALSQSGMFYEAHQARWVTGELPGSRLLQEPQGRHSSLHTPALLAGENGIPAAATSRPGTISEMPALHAADASTAQGDDQSALLLATTHAKNTSGTDEAAQAAGTGRLSAQEAASGGARPPEAPRGILSGAEDAGVGKAAFLATGMQPQSSAIPPELTPLVQQQLSALATQTFAWQGQIWPGQQMSWEIEEEHGQRLAGQDEASASWQTRLKLFLPQLGGIEATLRLQRNNEVEIAISAEQQSTTQTLDQGSRSLGQQFEAGGLKLLRLSISHVTPST